MNIINKLEGYPVEGLLAKSEKKHSQKKKTSKDTFASEQRGQKLLNKKIISSTELEGMEFNTINFKGVWGDFFGQPSLEFHCIIHGMPGEGKSTFAIQFAHYLAENFGKVVYISGEEGINKTLKEESYLRLGNQMTYEI